MDKVSRRHVMLGSAGLAFGAFALSCTEGAEEKTADQCWKYTKLSPNDVGQRVYDTFATNGCLYGAFKGAVMQYADAIAATDPATAAMVKSYPFVSLRGGRGGFRLKQLCGAVAGGVMFMSCFVDDMKKLTALVDKLGVYTAETELPEFVPQDDKNPNFLKVAAHGLTCREMGGAWMGKASPEQKKIVGERCKRHTASIMAKATELLNEHFGCK